MDTLNFLQRVLPSEGFFVTTVINPDGNKQGFFSTVEELAKAVIGLDQRGNNTYFAISSFLEKGSRKQENVRLTKVLVLDVDCGENKPFPSWKEGLKALGKFISDVGLPKPLIVHSGNGLHVYWVLDRELAPEEWKPLAEALKAATVAKGFDVDAGLTANSALVLRPIGTHNPKNGNEVKVLLDAESTTVAKMHVALADHFVSHRRHTTGSKLAQALNVESTLPPANAAVVAAKCQQIGWAIKNQKDVSEPMWYSLLGVAAYTTDPEATAIAWSEQHPAFDPDETMRKLEQWKRVTTGPATCAKFSTDRPESGRGTHQIRRSGMA